MDWEVLCFAGSARGAKNGACCHVINRGNFRFPVPVAVLLSGNSKSVHAVIRTDPTGVAALTIYRSDFEGYIPYKEYSGTAGQQVDANGVPHLIWDDLLNPYGASPPLTQNERESRWVRGTESNIYRCPADKDNPFKYDSKAYRRTYALTRGVGESGNTNAFPGIYGDGCVMTETMIRFPSNTFAVVENPSPGNGLGNVSNSAVHNAQAQWNASDNHPLHAFRRYNYATTATWTGTSSTSTAGKSSRTAPASGAAIPGMPAAPATSRALQLPRRRTALRHAGPAQICFGDPA